MLFRSVREVERKNHMYLYVIDLLYQFWTIHFHLRFKCISVNLTLKKKYNALMSSMNYWQIERSYISLLYLLYIPFKFFFCSFPLLVFLLINYRKLVARTFYYRFVFSLLLLFCFSCEKYDNICSFFKKCF